MRGIPVTQLVYGKTGEDDYNNDVFGFTAVQITSLGFVPGQTTESTEGTEQVTAQAELYLPFGTTVSALDRFVVNGETWEVNGHSSQWQSPLTGTPGVAMVRLRQVTGASAHVVAA